MTEVYSVLNGVVVGVALTVRATSPYEVYATTSYKIGAALEDSTLIILSIL